MTGRFPQAVTERIEKPRLAVPAAGRGRIYERSCVTLELLKKINRTGVVVLSLIMVAFQLFTSAYQPFPGMLQRSVHLGLGLGVCFLIFPMIKKPKNPGQEKVSYLLGFALAIVSLLCCSYVAVNWFEMSDPMRQIAPRPLDFVLGTIMFILVIVSTTLVCGKAMPIIGCIFCAYAMLGKYIPWRILRHTGVSYKQMISMGYLAQEGVFSSMLGVSTNQIFIFLVFGAILGTLKGGDFFLNWANSGFGKTRGGPAKVSVFGSALFGSISGSAVANVVGTGTITIPMMKRVGYNPEDAGAVEAVASTGGMIMPPVMGSASFLMAEITGCAYWEVCMMSILPVMLYYLALYICVDLKARRKNLQGLPAEEIPSGIKLLKEAGWIYIPPLLLLLFLLSVLQISANKACLFSCLLLLALAMLKPELRDNLRKNWVEMLVTAVRSSLAVITACAAAGMILLGLQTSGLITKMSNVLVAISGDNLYLLLVLVMLGSIVVGMGLPATESYMLLAILAAPALIVLGVPKLVAHYYVLFFGNLSAITPPVAMAAFAAAPIAGASGAKIGFKAFKIALPLFLIGYCLALNPALCLAGSVTDIVSIAIFCLCGTISASIGFERWLVHEVVLWRSVLYVLAGIVLIFPEIISSLIGLAVFVILFVTEKDSFKFFKKEQPIES